MMCVLFLKAGQERSSGLALRWPLAFKGSSRCFIKIYGTSKNALVLQCG